MKNQQITGRKTECCACGRTVGAHNYSSPTNPQPTRHHCPHGKWCSGFRKNDCCHKQECRDRQKAAEELEKKYPNFCRKCCGSGFRYVPGTAISPPESEPCNACLGLGKCPLCGNRHMLTAEHDKCDYYKCQVCGWDDWKIASGSKHPEIYPNTECYCYE